MSTTFDTASELRPFRVDVPEEAVDDLRRRVAATRRPSRELVPDRSQGVQLTTIQELARYWTTEYNWHACEARLNALPQFTTDIDGVDVHFIHVKSPHPDALPLIMTHGWPGSVIELLEAVGPLTDPTAHGGSAEDAFDLVLPSLPGYGFSSEPAEIGWDPDRIARAWAELMRRLGYTHYVAQGGDVGSAVTDAMGRQAAGLLGIHLNLLLTALGGPAPRRRLREGTRGARRDRHVQHQRQRLLPRAGHAAADDRLRAAGLTRRAGGLDARPRHRQLREDHPRLRRRPARGQPYPGQDRRQHHALLADRHRGLGRPGVLGDRAGPGSRRRPGAAGRLGPGRLHHVPRRDLPRPAQLGRGAYPSLSYFNEVDKGGHFAAWEEPELFASEIRAAFRPLRVNATRRQLTSAAGPDVVGPVVSGRQPRTFAATEQSTSARQGSAAYCAASLRERSGARRAASSRLGALAVMSAAHSRARWCPASGTVTD